MLEVLDVLYIVLIVFVSILWTLLTLALMRLIKILWVVEEITSYYTKAKKMLASYSSIPDSVKEKTKEILHKQK